jgi:hypothetical protein
MDRCRSGCEQPKCAFNASVSSQPRRSATTTFCGISESVPAKHDERLLPSLMETLGQSAKAGISLSTLFGKPCLKSASRSVAAVHHKVAVFKLSGAARDEALKLKGASLWDPSGAGHPMKQWVQVPTAHRGRYPELLLEALGNSK